MKSNHTNADNPSNELVDEMREIITDVNRFLVDWSARFVRCAGQANSSGQPDKVLRQQVAQFLADQKDWKSQKLIEQQQLDAIANQLTEAWIRLESEQRAIQHTGVTALVTRPPESRPDTVVIPIETIPANETISANETVVASEPIIAVAPVSIERLRSPVAASARVARPRDIIPRDAAIRQFEKLKNAMNSTRQSSL